MLSTVVGARKRITTTPKKKQMMFSACAAALQKINRNFYERFFGVVKYKYGKHTGDPKTKGNAD